MTSQAVFITRWLDSLKNNLVSGWGSNRLLLSLLFSFAENFPNRVLSFRSLSLLLLFCRSSKGERSISTSQAIGRWVERGDVCRRKGTHLIKRPLFISSGERVRAKVHQVRAAPNRSLLEHSVRWWTGQSYPRRQHTCYMSRLMDRSQREASDVLELDHGGTARYPRAKTLPSEDIATLTHLSHPLSITHRRPYICLLHILRFRNLRGQGGLRVSSHAHMHKTH